ncbi:MAG: hypothetical protein LQ340_007866 [Diploschistes diacapsis]|nr:MAG: hypothetical protein LQ340_007866 [Diploschistes diacapsis]
MGSTQFGDFHNFCEATTLPICNVCLCETTSASTPPALADVVETTINMYQIFRESPYRNNNADGFGGCELTGIPLSNGRYLRNLGALDAGGFTAVHLAAIAATTWILLLNSVVGYQLLDDGTALSLGAILVSAAAVFVGTGYIALDTAFSWTGHFNPSLDGPNNQNIGLYVLYQLFPLVCLAVFFVLETILVLRVLGERKPMRKWMCSLLADCAHSSPVYLLAAAVLFALGQIFQYVISPYICNGTSGKINGTLFETLFTLCSVVTIWIFWSSITEDDWPMPTAGGTYT